MGGSSGAARPAPAPPQWRPLSRAAPSPTPFPFAGPSAKLRYDQSRPLARQPTAGRAPRPRLPACSLRSPPPGAAVFITGFAEGPATPARCPSRSRCSLRGNARPLPQLAVVHRAGLPGAGYAARLMARLCGGREAGGGRCRSLSPPARGGRTPPHPPIEPRRWNPGFPRFFGSLETCLTSTVKILQIAETVFPLLNQVVGIMNVGHERGVVCAGERRLRGDARRGLEERRRASGAWIQTRIPPTRPIEPHHDPPRPPENGRRKQSLPHATSGKRFPIYTTLPVVGRLVSPLRQ